MKKSVALLILLCGASLLLVAKHKKASFLVEPSPTHASKNALTEDIGEELKRALHACATLADNLGRVQREVAALQKRLLTRVEKLIENRRCFKKARRSELNDALGVMKGVVHRLEAQHRQVQDMAVQMDANRCLKEKKTT